MNRHTIKGTVGKDPEIRSGQSGKRVATFSVATTEKWKDKSGEWKEATEWHTVVCFNDYLTEFIDRGIKKGATVWIEGKVKTRKWEKDGSTVYKTETILDLDGELMIADRSAAPPKKDSGGYGGGSSGGYGRGQSGGGQQQRKAEPAADLDDEIPF